MKRVPGITAAVACVSILGTAGFASAASVSVTDLSRQVEAALTFNGSPDSQANNLGTNPFAGIAEVAAGQSVRSRAAQQSSHRQLDADTYAMRSRSRVGFQTHKDFGGEDTASGQSVSAFRVAFSIADLMDYDLRAIGASSAAQAGATGGFSVSLLGEGIDVLLSDSDPQQQQRIGTLLPGDYLFTVIASVTGNGGASRNFQVDGQLFLKQTPTVTPVIPSPAAGFAGASLMVLLAVRRRRRA